MDPDLSQLDGALDSAGVDGYLLDAASTDADQRYLSGFGAPDPFHTLYDGDTHLLVSSLEYGRARTESRADTVARHATYEPDDADAEGRAASIPTLAAFLDAHDVNSVLVPPRFPVGAADGLREQGVAVTAEEARGTLTEIRATKTGEEIEHVRDAQAANERAMARAEELIREATVEEGVLHHEGAVLTSERVATAIEITLLREGYALDETIVACGADAADPHDRGSGPLEAGEPIIVDVFPRDKASNYHGDLARTFTKGDPGERVQEWYDLTHEAQRAALDAIEPGTTGAAVHDAVCDVYEDAGEPTLRDDPEAETGFIHGTGHGVGLDVHELPSVSAGGRELEPGHVITVEPGLYDPAVGGVRIEDLVVVTENGYENLTEYPKALVVE
jgi:Xaa-Pro aminopeptidase